MLILQRKASKKSAGKNLKPYQGLKPILKAFEVHETYNHAGKNLKPYQGLKLVWAIAPIFAFNCRKKPKTLSGIETFQRRTGRSGACRKKPKTLSGIETLFLTKSKFQHKRRKKPKTLSGIETLRCKHLLNLASSFQAGKNLKPYQGLKRAKHNLFHLGKKPEKT